MTYEVKLYGGQTATDILSEDRPTSQIIEDVAWEAHMIWEDYKSNWISKEEMEEQMESNWPEGELLDIWISIEKFWAKKQQETAQKVERCIDRIEEVSQNRI